MRYIFPQNPRFRLCPFWFETKWLKCLSVVAARVTAHDLNVFKGNGKAPSRFAYVEAQNITRVVNAYMFTLRLFLGAVTVSACTVKLSPAQCIRFRL